VTTQTHFQISYLNSLDRASSTIADPALVEHMLDIQFGEASDFGKVRTNNEDAVGSFIPVSRQQARSHGFLFVVADGVGGLDLGEVASSTAISVITEEFGKAQSGSMLISLLPRLVQRANSAVHDCTLSTAHRGKKMATTVVACALRYDQAVISHVGDSRCYLIRNGRAKQVTQDHTLVNEQKKIGLITADEIAHSDARHVLIRSLGPEMFVSADTTAITLQPGDVLVLSTDGLHDELGDEEIATIASQKKDAAQIARELVARAVEIDGGDNTTVQVIRVRSVEQVGMYRGRPYRLPA
jgi:PPM family protein phosphatase